jgi:hypothetical protein
MSNFSTDASIVSFPDPEQLDTAAQQLRSSPSLKQQLAAIEVLTAAGDRGYLILIDFLRNHQGSQAQVAEGKAYQALCHSNSPVVQSFLATELPAGVVSLESPHQENLQELQRLLSHQDYETADRLTLQILCQLAGPAAVARKWVYFTEVNTIPIAEMQLLDILWRVYSEDKFGFSKQREIWLSVNRNWERLWEKLAWKSGNLWTRYPGEFIWDLSAPPGHLPLSNQLRGVRMMECLLCHPAWGL